MSTETIALLLKSMTTSHADLVKRIESLEQSLQDSRKEKDKSSSADANKEDKEKEKGKETQEQQNSDPAQNGAMPSEAKPENLLGTYVEFRKQIYSDGGMKLEWVTEEAEVQKATSLQKPFRYDTHESGKLTFSVFRSAKLYDKLLELCPPAHDGQVNLAEDRLEFSDVFPLLHCRASLQEYEGTLGDAQLDRDIRDELKVLNELYEREGHLLYAHQRYEALLQSKKIDCESLKGLFHPDQLVVFRELRDEWAVARVTMVTSNDEYNILGTEVALELECKAIDFDGKSHRAHLYRRDIDKFTGTRNITELPVYPLAYFSEKDRLIQDSIESGRRWKTLHDKLTTRDGLPSAVVMQYVGYCETFGDDGEDEEAGRGGEVPRRATLPTRQDLITDG